MYRIVTHLTDNGYRISVIRDGVFVQDLFAFDDQVIKMRNSLATGIANQGFEYECDPIPERATSRKI